MTMTWTLTPSQNQTCRKNQIILAQGEWSSAKDVGPILKSCNTTQQQTFFNMVNVSVFGISENLRSIQKIQGTISQWNRCWTFLEIVNRRMIGDEEVTSLSHAKVYVLFRFCVLLWKYEREPTSKYCLGRQADVDKEFATIQSFWTQLMVTQWNSSRILSQDSPHCSSATKSKRSFLKWAKN